MSERSILVCDDEIEIAEELAEFFASNGWRVRLCNNAGTAKRMLLEGPRPLALLTDLRLDDIDGAALVEFSRGLPRYKRPMLHAIMTGYVRETTTPADLGTDVLYMKPVDPVALLDDLESRLATVLGEHALDAR
jgi:CheY-like chemotaxis protein